MTEKTACCTGPGGNFHPAIKPPVIYKSCLGVMVAGKLWFWPNAAPMFSSWKEPAILGTLLIAAGATLALDSKRSFRQTGTPMMGGPVRGQESKLHVSGNFSWTRNPMYLGISSALVGAVIASNCWWHLALPGMNAVLMDRYYIPMEERDLEKEFGVQYLEYKRRVPRWI